MSFPVILADASSRFHSLFFILAIAFAVAAIVWLLIWLFSEGDAGEYSVRSGADDDSSRKSSADSDEASAAREDSTASDDAGSDSAAAEQEDTDGGSLDLIGAGSAAAAATTAAVAADDSSDTADEDSSDSDGTSGGDSDDDDEDDFEAATEEEAASLFASELEAGDVKQDPVYGIIYNKAPDEVDDLKEIKGVAKVLEGKLNGVGVYRFKQIAVWTDAACAEFSKMLTFKNRIYTDNWLEQAKDFHEEKYGEKL